jgi:hypothetical protein
MINISNYIPLPRDPAIAMSVLALGFIPFIWVIGHLTAVAYFNSFGVNYSHAASLNSGLIFAVQHMSGLLKSLFLITIFLHFVWLSFYSTSTDQNDASRFQLFKNIFLMMIRIFIMFTLSIVIMGAGSGKLGETLADIDKEKINNLGYPLSNIILNDEEVIKCAFLWGDISNFSLVISNWKSTNS